MVAYLNKDEWDIDGVQRPKAVVLTDTSGNALNPTTTTSLPTGGTPTAGTTSLTTTASIQLAANACKEITIQNDPDNLLDVLVGDSGSQTFQLLPGQAITLPVSNSNLIYAKNASSTTQPINWITVN